ncbi:MAG: hypothetical protein JKY09_07450 [Crocinitomicaceae bacterium]|nr:hypothetical protein [Crocinitomicaceae bacterium]
MENSNNIKKRGGTGKVFTESYNPGRIDRLKSIIRDFRNQGKPKRYCILIDGEMVVSVNKDARNFDNYKKYLEGDTQNIEVRMFFGDSPNCNRHIFQTSQNSLSGVNQKDVEQQIKEALEKQRIQTELEMLRDKLKRRDQKIKEYEEILAEMDDKQIDIKQLLKDGMEFYGKYNSNKKAATPIQGIPQPQVEVEVESEPETKSEKFYKKLKNQYSEKELQKSLKTWGIFTAYPGLREEFTKIINLKIKKDGEA